MLVEFQLRIRTANDSADALVVTSVRGGTNPDLAGDPPTGDGATLDPLTGKITAGSITGRIVDRITSGTSRLFTSQLEDANFRQQLGQRKAYWEFRVDAGAWQTLYAGRLSRYSLASDVEWDVTVSDWMKAEHEYTVFDALPTETIAQYLARWPNRGAIIGGPILGGFREVQDLGGWEFKVARSYTSATLNYVVIEFVRGFFPNGFATTVLTEQHLNHINEAAKPFAVRGRYVDNTDYGRVQITAYSFPDLVVILDGDTANPRLAIAPSLGVGARQELPFLAGGLENQGTPSLVLEGTLAGLGLSLNQVVKVEVISRKVSKASPIYWQGHPADLAPILHTEAAIPYVSSSVTTVKNTLGADLQITLEIDKAWNLGTILEEAVYGPFGIGARGAEALADAGKIEFFCSRIFTNIVPTTTITDADVIEKETRAFALDTAGAIKRLTFEHQRFTYGNMVGELDIFAKQTERFERDNGDPDAIGTGKVEYNVPGMVHFLDSTNLDLRRWVDGRAHEIFDRRGRGEIGLETVLIRGGAGDAVKLGDEILVNVKQLPNKNKRLGDDPSVGARAMQVVHVTPTLRGKKVTLEDSGPNAAAITTLPTHTIAASTIAPRNTALVTITNAAALTAAGYALRVQFAVTTGAAPATTDYTDALYFSAADIPTTGVGLPSVTAGRTVYVRARTEKAAARPSNWSTGVSVTLTAINAPTALSTVAVSGNGSLLDMTWTIGANAAECLTDVYVRASGAAFSTAVKRATLLPGSTQYRVEGLTASTAYTVSVQHVDLSTGDVSPLTEDTETTNGSSVTLNPPTTPAGFSTPVSTHRGGLTPGSPSRTSRYGIAVMATEQAAFVEVEEAVETAVGSGTYGSFVVVGKVASVSGDWTIWQGMAPNDGLRRQLRAKHVSDGYTSSTNSATVTVSPWTAQPLAAPLTLIDSRTGAITTGTGRFTGTLTTTPQTVATFPVPTDIVALLEAKIIGRAQSGGAQLDSRVLHRPVENVAGTLTLGDQTVVSSTPALTFYSVILDTSGTDVRLRVAKGTGSADVDFVGTIVALLVGA